MDLEEKVVSLQEYCENAQKMPGPKGNSGIVGPPGPKGDTGEIGPSGPVALKGYKGYPGIPRLNGSKGDNGAVDLSGPVGPKGSKGDLSENSWVKECWDYKILNESTRNINYKRGVLKCDLYIGYADVKLGTWKGSGWYRFMGPAGTRMPESPPVFSSNSEHACGTRNTGWLNGQHPTTLGVLVSREVHFKRSPSETNDGSPITIKIRHCGSYFVYYLPNVRGCYRRYCAE